MSKGSLFFLKFLALFAYAVACVALNDAILALPIGVLYKWLIFIVGLLIGFIIIVLDSGDEDITYQYVIMAGKIVFLPVSILSCVYLFDSMPLSSSDWSSGFYSEILQVMYLAFVWKVFFRSGVILSLATRIMGFLVWPFGRR